MTYRVHIRRRQVAPTALMIIALSGGAGCHVRDAGPEEPVADDTRGMHVEEGRLGLEHSLQVRPSENGVPRELRDGDTVRTADRIRAWVVTSEDAYLYLAFCSGHQLSVYPAQAGIRTSAGVPMMVPERADVVVDGTAGAEVLYLILSKKELSLADPQLAEAIRKAGQDVDCSRLDAELGKPGSGRSGVPGGHKRALRGKVVPKKPMPTPSGPVDQEPPPPDPDFVRKGEMVWYSAKGAGDPGEVFAADAEGIAIVRYRFVHVAPSRSP